MREALGPAASVGRRCAAPAIGHGAGDQSGRELNAPTGRFARHAVSHSRCSLSAAGGALAGWWLAAAPGAVAGVAAGASLWFGIDLLRGPSGGALAAAQ